jgi:hydroxyacyl-ACP dehydratase HTD2-like protein with hotdog domain
VTVLMDNARALIGTVAPKRTAQFPLDHDTLRRFSQAVMEPTADDASFPPLYPLHALRRPTGSADPFDRFADDPDWDGIEFDASLGGLPRPELPLTRLLNGGVEAEFFCLAEVGDVISSQARYADISERAGRTGPMVFLVVETDYTNQHGQLLTRVRSTIIVR